MGEALSYGKEGTPNVGVYYRPSGRVTWYSVAGGFVVGLIAGALVSGGYVNCMSDVSMGYRIGGMYVRMAVFGPIVFAIVLGSVIGWTMRALKSRSAKVTGGVALLVSVLWYYGICVIWLSELKQLKLDARAFLSPGAVVAGMTRVLSSSGASDTSAVASGGFRLLVWIAEAAVLVGGSGLVAMRMVSARPFCERCGVWCEKKSRFGRWTWPGTMAMVQEALERGDWGVLPALGDAAPDAQQWVSVVPRTCPTCKAFHTVDVARVDREKNSYGDMENKEHLEIKGLVISTGELDALRGAVDRKA